MSETRADYPPNWRLAPDYDPNDHMMNLKGKEYLNVQHRLLWFMRDQRDMIASGLATMPYVIRNELVELDREQGWAHFRATVRDVLGNESTMYGSESARDFPDYIEKAGTKALGRALLALGYGAAFAPELDEGERVVDSPAERRQPTAQPATQRTEKPATSPTPQQTPSNRQAPPAPVQRAPEAPSAPADDRVSKALQNQSVLGLLTDLGITAQVARRAKVGALLQRLDAAGTPVTARAIMDALDAELTARRANGHDLAGAFNGAQPN